jgi:tol-pal system protein YbgF
MALFRKLTGGAAALFLMVSAAAPAMAQNYSSSADSLADRLSRLESAIQDLQATVYSVEGGSYSSQPGSYELPVDGSVGGELVVRIGQLERELQALTGRMEELAYKIEQNSNRLDTMQQVLNVQNGGATASFDVPNYGAGSSGGYASGATASSGPSDLADSRTATSEPYSIDTTATEQPAVSPAASVTLPTDVNEAFEYAFNALLNGDYELAEGAFAAFLTTYPDDPRAADAQFRLGEIYLATGDNLQAAKAFLNHIKQWPSDPRAAESYLKLGTAYGRLGKNQEACNIFNVMSGKYPNASAAVKQRLAIERGNYGC